MIYTTTAETFNLYSSWTCDGREIGGVWRWYISGFPSRGQKTIDFPVKLPSDAVIKRAWISASYGSPLSGAAENTVNGVKVSSSGETDMTDITSEMSSYTAVFVFRANGIIFEDTGSHSSTLGVREPTLNIEYSSESEEAPLPDEDDPGNITRQHDDGGYMPRLLDSNLNEIARLEVDRVSIEINLHPLSTAVVDVLPGQPTVKVRDFLELFSPEGSVGIFRVTQVETMYVHDMAQRLYLEHSYTTLADDLAIGVQAMTGTFASVIGTLMEAQTTKHWTLGDVEIPDEYEVVYAYGYDTILQSVQSIVDMAPDGYMQEFDTLHHPWTMHIRAYKDDDFCECRLSRNLSSATVNLDTSDLCTRVYPYGAGEGTDRINLSSLTGALFIDSDTKDVWGTVTKTFADDDIYDAITLQEVAARYLERHKNPTVSVTLDAIALYAATGETIDKFRVGRLCRLPMHDYGVMMNERVISINYPDVYGTPEHASVILANKVRDASNEIAYLMREASTSKLIGGTVETSEIKSSASNITSNGPMVSRFDIAGYGNLLAARVTYSCNPSSKCSISVDGTSISGSQDMGTTVDIFPYLDRDESGVPLLGEHYVRIRPINTGVNHWVHSTIILKTIEKK